jgi:RNA polymerase sigma-70 factor, ECF subfamily
MRRSHPKGMPTGVLTASDPEKFRKRRVSTRMSGSCLGSLRNFPASRPVGNDEREDWVDEIKWLMAKEIPRLRRYALSLTGEISSADDLVQDCLERAIRKRHLWKRHGSIRNWLYRILYNVFLNQAAQRNKLRRQVTLEDAPGDLVEPARQEQQIVCQDIAAAMQALPEEQRAAIALTAVEGLSYEEAADVLDVPVGTLRSRLFRGRDKLRELFSAPEPVPLRRVK